MSRFIIAFAQGNRFGKLSGEEFKRTVEVWEKNETILKTLGELTGGYYTNLLDRWKP